MFRQMNTRILFAAFLLGGTALTAERVVAVGLMPVPMLDHVSVRATASFDPNVGQYAYRYTIQNPGSNTGEIWNIKMDVRQDPRFSGGLPASGLTIPFGTATIPFSEMLRSLEPLLDLPPGVSVVPFGQQTPPGWHGGLGIDGYARFSVGNAGSKILPGDTMSGFTMISYGVPTIRETQVVADWVLIVEDHDAVTEEQLEQAAIAEKTISFTAYTLGPSSLNRFGSDDHWTQLAADIQRAVPLGWITDNALAQSLQDQLNFARQALDQNDGTLAKTRLQTVVQTMINSSAGQRNQEVFDLVTLNVQRLISSTPDTPVPFEPVYSLTPSTATHAIGIEHAVTAKVVNAADHDAPVPGRLVSISIVDGPHAPASWFGRTGANGEFAIKYVGTKVGTDHIVLTEILADRTPLESSPIRLAALDGALATMLVGFQRFPGALAEAEVTWTGGPDLVVPFFMPPEIISQGGNPVFITEITENIGILNALVSVTRYYLSSTLPVDPKSARVVGERAVPLLEPGKSSDQNTLQFRLPNGLPAGVYYLAACADADGGIAELDEDNNCSFNKLTTSVSNVVPALEVTNTPPDCAKASPSVGTVWPPNHKLVNVTINGVTDPDNDAVSIRIIDIRQDEPVDGLGDGDTSPDGFGIGTTTAQVRAERSGIGNGRVYEISFTAEDGQGGSCQGRVSVGVPHDQGEQAVPVNDGAHYDSTVS